MKRKAVIKFMNINKKLLSFLLSSIMILVLSACDTQNSANQDTPNNVENRVNDSIENNENKSIEYISDRRVQYDESNKQHIVFFGLQNSSNTYLSTSGIASITISDKSDAVIFQKDIAFSEKDFTDWTNQMWDSSRYLCGLYIKDTELQGSTSSSGNLTIKVTLDNGVYFDSQTLNISDLPSITVKVNLPAIPTTYTDMRYSSYTSTVQISKLEYSSEVGYDGEATLHFDVVLKLLSKTENINESSTIAIGYKLYNSDNIVVDSGHIYSDPIAVGESSKDDFSVYDLDPRDVYTLKFENAS